MGKIKIQNTFTRNRPLDDTEVASARFLVGNAKFFECFRPIAWDVRLDDTYWTDSGGYNPPWAVWDGEKWVGDEFDYAIWLNPIGNWYQGQRPKWVRVEFNSDVEHHVIGIYGAGFEPILDPLVPGGGAYDYRQSGDELELDWSAGVEMRYFYIYDAIDEGGLPATGLSNVQITNIEWGFPNRIRHEITSEVEQKVALPFSVQANIQTDIESELFSPFLLFIGQSTGNTVNDGYVDTNNNIFDNTGQNTVIAGSGNFPGQNVWGFLRFPNANIPQGSTILSAKMMIFGQDSGSSGSSIAQLRLMFEYTGNSAEPTDRANMLGRTFTDSLGPTGYVDWAVPSWPYPREYRESPELKDALQHVVSRPDWVKTNAIMFMAKNNGSPGWCNRSWQDYRYQWHGSWMPTYLVVAYEVSDDPIPRQIESTPEINFEFSEPGGVAGEYANVDDPFTGTNGDPPDPTKWVEVIRPLTSANKATIQGDMLLWTGDNSPEEVSRWKSVWKFCPYTTWEFEFDVDWNYFTNSNNGQGCRLIIGYSSYDSDWHHKLYIEHRYANEINPRYWHQPGNHEGIFGDGFNPSGFPDVPPTKVRFRYYGEDEGALWTRSTLWLWSPIRNQWEWAPAIGTPTTNGATIAFGTLANMHVMFEFGSDVSGVSTATCESMLDHFRVNEGVVLGAAGYNPSDDFRGDDGDDPDESIWRVVTRDSVESTPKIQDNKLYMYHPAGNVTNPNLETKYRLQGTFDVQIDFEMILPAAPALEHKLTFCCEGGGENHRIERKWNNGKIEYRFWNNGNNRAFWEYTYEGTRTGKMRLTRDVANNYVHAQVEQLGGGWRVLYAGGATYNTNNMKVYMYLDTGPNGYPESAAYWDNYIVNVGTLVF